MFFEEEKGRHLFPSRIVSIINAEENGFDKIRLVVQCCVRTLQDEHRLSKRKGGEKHCSEYVTKDELEAANSAIFETWTFDPTFYIVPLEAYSSPCLVFWNVLDIPAGSCPSGLPGIKRFVVTQPRSEWCHLF